MYSIGVKNVIGYARVSTRDQDPQLQVDALQAAGCEQVFTDHGVSGKLTSRPEFDKALAALQPGDVMVVWKLDRLGRSLQHLVEVVNGLKDRGIGFRSLTEQIDASNGMGKLVFHLFAALAEFERDLIRERTLAGLEAARRQGRTGGRKNRLSPEQRALAGKMHQDGETVTAIARILNVSRPVVYRAIEEAKGKTTGRRIYERTALRDAAEGS
jgi:DNA invertase Pin-like site-specific DNA recombinase